MNELEGAATPAGTTQDDRDTTQDDRGASLVEYALLVALIAVACILAITFLGDEAGENFSRTASAVSNAGE